MLLLSGISKTEVTGSCNAGFTFCLVPCIFIFSFDTQSCWIDYSDGPDLKYLVAAALIKKKKRNKETTLKTWLTNLSSSFPEVHCRWITGQSYWYFRCHRNSNWRKTLW